MNLDECHRYLHLTEIIYLLKLVFDFNATTFNQNIVFIFVFALCACIFRAIEIKPIFIAISLSENGIERLNVLKSVNESHAYGMQCFECLCHISLWMESSALHSF